jgi:hypothetical protein
MRRFFTALASIPCIALVVSQAQSGTLQIGEPLVQDGRYVFPVHLDGGEGQVTALDFRFDYDPTVFSPIAAAGGAMAVQAGKVVNANMTAPGNYRVVMMGLNQTPVGQGEVARITMQRLGENSVPYSDLGIGDPTLATGNGSQLSADGGARRVELDGEQTDNGSETDAPAEPPAEDESDPGDVPSQDAQDDPVDEDDSTTPLTVAEMEDGPGAGSGSRIPGAPGLAAPLPENGQSKPELSGNFARESAVPDDSIGTTTEQKSGIAESINLGLNLDIGKDVTARLGGNSEEQRANSITKADQTEPRTNVAAVQTGVSVETLESNSSNTFTDRAQSVTAALQGERPSNSLGNFAGGAVLTGVAGGLLALWLLRKKLFD